MEAFGRRERRPRSNSQPALIDDCHKRPKINKVNAHLLPGAFGMTLALGTTTTPSSSALMSG
jgi:hypothetical protein